MNAEEEYEGPENDGKVIAIASGKGGTGKTISALNLGMALHELDKHALVIDSDLEDPNIGVNLGIYSPQITINDVLEKEKNLIEALYIHESGLRVVPASLSINYLNPKVRALSDIVKSMDGYVLLDCGPGLNNNLLNTLEVADSVVAITNPIRSSISGTMRLIEIARDMGKDIEGIIVNNITSKESSIEEIENLTGCDVLGEVPYDKNVDQSTVNKIPLVKYKPHSPAATAFRKICHNMLDIEYNRTLSDRLKSSYHNFRDLLGF